jgi:hypothetical protein
VIAERKAKIGIQMGLLNLNPAIWQTRKPQDFRGPVPLGYISDSSDPTDALPEIMIRTSTEVYFHADKVEIRGQLPIEVPFDDGEDRSSSTSRGLG